MSSQLCLYLALYHSFSVFNHLFPLPVYKVLDERDAGLVIMTSVTWIVCYILTYMIASYARINCTILRSFKHLITYIVKLLNIFAYLFAMQIFLLRRNIFFFSKKMLSSNSMTFLWNTLKGTCKLPCWSNKMVQHSFNLILRPHGFQLVPI